MNLDARTVAAALGGEVVGRDAVLVPGPGHSRADRSLSVKLSGPEGFVVFSHAGDDFAACREHVRNLLGLSPSYQVAERPPKAKPNRQPDDNNQRAAMRVWKAATSLGGTLGEQYLIERRRLDVRHLDLGHVLRWHAGERCIVSLMTDATTGEATGIHRTLLDHDSTKLTRKMLGRKGCIRLSPDDAVTLGLGLVEGVEDGLAVLLSGWSPVWAAADAGAMARFPVLAGVECLTLFADADTAGTNAAQKCSARWNEAGHEARISPPVRTRDVG